MKTLFAAAAVAAVAAFAAPAAMAQTMMGPISGYGDVGYAYAHEDPINLSAVQGRLGARSTYVGVEGQLAFGIEVPHCEGFVAPLLYAIPVQLLAYHIAVLKGTDIDQPRNLAKSVTVE